MYLQTITSSYPFSVFLLSQFNSHGGHGKCVLFRTIQGYAAEMDNPAMASIIPAALQNKKNVLFGNMQEIYFFHKT